LPVVQPLFCTIAVLTEDRLGQGTKKPEAGQHANEARVALCFTERLIGMLKQRKIRCFIFEFENLHNVNNDQYEIQIYQFNNGCHNPRIILGSCKWLCAKNFKIRYFK
jgi:hypothetical protein